MRVDVEVALQTVPLKVAWRANRGGACGGLGARLLLNVVHSRTAAVCGRLQSE